MLNPTAQRTAGIFALTLAMLAGGRFVPAAAQTTPPPVTPPATSPATQPPVTPPIAPPTAPASQAPVTTSTVPPPTRVTVNPSVTRSPMAPTVRPPAVKLASNIAAIVDGSEITRDDVLGMFEMIHGRSIVNQLIQIKALQGEAKRQGVTVTPAEVTAAMKKISDDVVQRQMASGQGPMTFKEIAKEQGLSPAYIEWDAYLETLRTKTFMKAIEALVPPLSSQVKVAHILIATIPLTNDGQVAAKTTDADQAKKDADAKVKIDGILADIKSGKITFENAAKTYSDDKSNSADGGVLPYAARNTFDKSFEEAAFGMTKVGEIAGPIKSRFGWHLIKMIAIGKDAPPVEQKSYRDQQIADVMKNPQSMQSWFNQVVQKSKITINPDPVLIMNPKSPLNGLNLPAVNKSFSK